MKDGRNFGLKFEITPRKRDPIDKDKENHDSTKLYKDACEMQKMYNKNANLLPKYHFSHRRSVFTFAGGEIHVNTKDKMKGSYGVVYPGRLFYDKKGDSDGKKGTAVVIKLSRQETGDFLDEIMMSLDLYCNTSKKWKAGMAKIPHIYGFGECENLNRYLVVMESLEGDAVTLLEQGGPFVATNRDLECYNMFNQVNQLLILLQKELRFMHRDLHLGNIMYKQVDKKIQWYLIDFGVSRVHKDNKAYILNSNMYTKDVYNTSYDMRVLLASFFQYVIDSCRTGYVTELCQLPHFLFFVYEQICLLDREIEKNVRKYVNEKRHLFTSISLTGICRRDFTLDVVNPAFVWKNKVRKQSNKIDISHIKKDSYLRKYLDSFSFKCLDCNEEEQPILVTFGKFLRTLHDQHNNNLITNSGSGFTDKEKISASAASAAVVGVLAMFYGTYDSMKKKKREKLNRIKNLSNGSPQFDKTSKVIKIGN